MYIVIPSADKLFSVSSDRLKYDQVSDFRIAILVNKFVSIKLIRNYFVFRALRIYVFKVSNNSNGKEEKCGSTLKLG